MDEFTLKLTEKSASALRDWFEEQDEAFIDNVLKGEGSFILEHGGKRVTLAPVRRGKWAICGTTWECSECGAYDTFAYVDDIIRSKRIRKAVLRDNYCPSCGAKMYLEGQK